MTKTNAQSDIGLTSVNIFTNFIYALKCLGEILREILTCTRNESYCCGDFDRNKTTFAIILYNNKDFILKIEHVYNNMCMLYI